MIYCDGFFRLILPKMTNRDQNCPLHHLDSMTCSLCISATNACVLSSFGNMTIKYQSNHSFYCNVASGILQTVFILVCVCVCVSPDVVASSAWSLYLSHPSQHMLRVRAKVSIETMAIPHGEKLANSSILQPIIPDCVHMDFIKLMSIMVLKGL